MIDREVFDALQIKELKKKLEPISYLVYGTTPAKVTIDKLMTKDYSEDQLIQKNVSQTNERKK
jgi:hypothetical protein